ncbi:MAG: hypothetical protein R3B09_14825 [Nannocystaceae bacterium]
MCVALVASGCATTEDVTAGSSFSAGNLSAGNGTSSATEGTDGTTEGSSTTKGSSSSASSSGTSSGSTGTSEPTTSESDTGTTDASTTEATTTDDTSSGTTGLDCADGLGNLCGNPMDIGIVEEGGSAMSPMGTITTPGVADWYHVQFPAVGRPGGGTPSIQFMMNEDDAFVFDLYLNTGCMAAAVTCEAGGEAGKGTKLTEFTFVDDDPMCCSGPQDSLTPWPANLYLRVYRVDGGETCSAYQLVFTR